MSTLLLTRPLGQTARADRGHKLRLLASYIAAITLIVGLAIYGFDYYTLDAVQRPHSAKHALLKPGGVIGIKLGLLGLAMFLVIFLYPIRKRWAWLAQKGNSRHWLDFHVLLGLAAPFVIALHSSFKFRGFAGMAFWIMVAVSLSGVVGRYLYAQVPRRASAAELSLKETRDAQNRLAAELTRQRVVPVAALRPLFRLPSEEQVARLPMIVVLAHMLALDVMRPIHIAKLRRSALAPWESLPLLSLGGFFRTENAELERVIALARTRSVLAKRALFFSRAEQVFHLWHVAHKPFSYSFAILAAIHIAVVWLLGYM